MKRNELLKQLNKEGCIFLRSGSKHDIYINPKTGQKQAIPRHSEIDNSLAVLLCLLSLFSRKNSD